MYSILDSQLNVDWENNIGFSNAQKAAEFVLTHKMARTIARAIREAVNRPAFMSPAQSRLCVCGCGRLLTGQRSDQRSATPACRKRLEKRRRESPDKSTAW